MPNTIYDELVDNILPTYLYIKRHSITGLRYFGKTQGDPNIYLGLGKYWKSHIKAHGIEFIITELIIGPYTNRSQLMALATWISAELDIVNSSEWANLIPENGIDGYPLGVPRGPATGDRAKGMPRKGGGPKGVPATGRNAKGMPRAPKTGRAAKGQPNTGGAAKGQPKTGRRAKGLSLGPATGKNAKGYLKGPQPTITCDYCGKTCGQSAATRFHGDNCKQKP